MQKAEEDTGREVEGVTLRCTFRPQAWQRNYAIEVDPEGETEWSIPWTGRLPQEHSDESDLLREHENAPEWVREWHGPFEVDYEVEDRESERSEHA